MKKSVFLTVLISVPLTVLITIAASYIYSTLNKKEVSEFQNSQVTPINYTSKVSANNDITNQRENAITNTVKNVSPAVVGINVTEVYEYRDPFSSFFDDPFFRDDPLFRRFFGDRTYKQEVQSIGSGFIISEDGYIVTNDHVAGNAKKIVVTLTNGDKYDAEIVGSDYTSDICLLKIDGKNLPYLKLGNSDDIIIGEWAIALGNPFGLFNINDKPTVTVGVISALNQNLEPLKNRYYRKMIQTDAAINGGNSGGPLVNSLGEVIGMNTIIYSGGGGSAVNIGIGFAIPINKIKTVISDLKANKKIERDFWTGISIQTLTDNLAKYFGLPKNTKGVVITQIERNSPGERAGLEVGDVIFEVEGEKIHNENDIRSLLFEYKTNQVITLKVLHDGKIVERKLKLEKRR